MRKGKRKGRAKKRQPAKRAKNGAAIQVCSKRTKAADALTAFVAESEAQKQIMLRVLDRARLRHACLGSRRPLNSLGTIESATGGKVPAVAWEQAPEGPPPRDLYLRIGYRKPGRETDSAN
jgi:hypothetical protein